MSTFSKALEASENNTLVKRQVWQNDAVMVTYKERLYQMCTTTGVRYPYSPTNKDIFAKDWVDNQGNELKQNK